MTDISEQPPDDNEAFEPFDEAMDDEDAVSGDPGGGHEAARDLDTELVVDEAELEEAGANLDDAERIGLIDGGMDDPDGTGPPGPGERMDEEAGWDRDPVEQADKEAARDRDPVGGAGSLPDGPDVDDPDRVADPELELIDTDATDLDQIPDDAPGPDSARW